MQNQINNPSVVNPKCGNNSIVYDGSNSYVASQTARLLQQILIKYFGDV